MEKKLANIEREKKEDNLRQLAQKARDSRAGLRGPANEGQTHSHNTGIFQHDIIN